MLDINDYNYSVVVKCSFGRRYSLTLSSADWSTVGQPTSVFLLFLPHCFAQIQQAETFEFGLKHLNLISYWNLMVS